MSQSLTSDQLDVAIVGGGVSGLYSAWRLLLDAEEKGTAPPRITVFEMSERIGGRLLSWLPAGPDGGLRAELGGMRFFEQQQLVWNLLGELGFKEDIVDFYVAGKNLRLLLRGVSTPLETPEPAARYMVDEKLSKKSAAEILKELIEEVLATPENKQVLAKYLGGKLPKSREQWDLIKPYLTWRKRPLWDVGFWNMLSEIHDPETYQFIADAFGYYSIAANWNAAEALQSTSLDFTENPEYRTLRQGYSALPDALAAAVTELGGVVATGTRLVSFEAAGENVSASFVGPGGPAELEAGSLVLALPRRSLELLAPSPAFDLEGNPALKSLLESVASMPAFKLFLFFEQRWWEKLGIDRGRSICDLPLRQTYYMAPDSHYQEEEGVPPWGLLMASYDDQRAVEFWQGLVPPADEWEAGREELRRSLADLAAKAGPAAIDEAVVPEPPPELHLATQEMIDHAIEQLALLHDIPAAKIPAPAVGAFADWAFDPFGGGWNFWKPQVDVRTAMTGIKRPFGETLPAYVVGEAYSGVQGWVEGALTSAELVLEQHFGLDRPDWLPAGYYLGW